MHLFPRELQDNQRNIELTVVKKPFSHKSALSLIVEDVLGGS